MNAPAALPALPLDGLPPSNPPSEAAVGGKTLGMSEQYRRLFGLIPPAAAIQSVTASGSSDGDEPCGPPPVLSRDPKETSAGHPFLSSCSAAVAHPSIRSLASIADLRLHHIAKGHTPEADARHGPVFFMAAARAWWERAKHARTAEGRRKAMVAAAAIFVAMIDAHDFTQAHGARFDEGL